MNQNDPDFIEQLALTIHDRLLNMDTTLKDNDVMLPQFFEEVINVTRIVKGFMNTEDMNLLLGQLRLIGIEAFWCRVMEIAYHPGLICMGFEQTTEVNNDYLFVRMYKGVNDGPLCVL